MRVYKYYRAKWGRQAIIQQRLKLTTLSDINDPFEFRAIGTKDKSLRRKLEEWRKDIPGGMGLISFCGNRKNPVIWSHYADNYSGICLGFDIDDSYLCQVRYVRDRVITTEAEMQDALSRGGSLETSSLLATKFEHWGYEEEKRVFYHLNEDEVIHEGDLYFVQFGTMFKLREIILGPRYSPSDDAATQKEISLAKQSLEWCEIKTARAAFGKFEVVPQNDKRRQKML